VEFFLADTWGHIPEYSHQGVMLYGFIQLVASIWLSRIIKRPER